MIAAGGGINPAMESKARINSHLKAGVSSMGVLLNAVIRSAISRPRILQLE
ncbi:MAG: hypothetical protein R3C03_04770 [Pirellulaceae bacterium]